MKNSALPVVVVVTHKNHITFQYDLLFQNQILNEDSHYLKFLIKIQSYE